MKKIVKLLALVSAAALLLPMASCSSGEEDFTAGMTEEEKAEARREAMRRATQEAYAQLTKHPQAKKAANDKSNTPTLF